MRQLFAFAVPSVLLLLTGCSSSGGGGGGSPATQIGVGGGQLVGSGNLAGVVLTVPANALGGDTQITAMLAIAAPSTGFSVTGVAVQFGPAGTVFNPPATLTLPYDPARVPVGASLADSIVEHLSPSGTLTQLTPTAIDTTNHTVTVSIGGFSAYWTALPTPGSGGEQVDTTEYLLFGSPGTNTYSFEGGTFIQAHSDNSFFPQPPFPTFPSQVLTFGDPATFTYEHWLLSRESNGDLLQHGLDHVGSPGFFDEVTDPAGFLPAIAETGEPSTSAFDYDGYLGSTQSVDYTGHTNFSVVVHRVPPVSTPAGVFEDVIKVVLTYDWVELPADSGHDVTTLYLARDVGPVMYQIDSGNVMGPLVRLTTFSLNQ
jgi:hypothetical protein